MGNNLIIEKTSFSPNIKPELLTKELTTLISCNNWSITTGKYTTLNMQQVFKSMYSTQLETFLLEENHYPKTYSILLDFCHVNFTHLQILVLDNNEIKNIEPLSWMVAPNLEALSLNNNKIVSISSLNKCHYPETQSISIKSNKICELSEFSNRIFITNNKINTNDNELLEKNNSSLELLIDDPKYYNLVDYMFSNGNSADFILVNDISFVVKIGVMAMTRLGVADQKRIYQPIIQERLKEKWMSIIIQNSSSAVNNNV